MILGSLVVLRHAKSAYPVGVVDHDRPLNDRGRRDARAAGIWLNQHRHIWGENIPKILVSTAVRAQETWALVSQEFNAPHLNESKIYEAAISTLIDLVNEDISSGKDVLIIGHNPGLEQLALFLSQEHVTPERESAAVKFPTSAIAVLEVLDTSWSQSSARLSRFVVPRG
jgi:phosphohistidine phosphatase